MKKKLFSALKALLALATISLFTLSSTGLAAENVHIESKLLVANGTRGDIEYKPQTTAKVDEVVKFEIWYHNTESPDSGKTANNLNVKIAIPTTKTKSHTATSTVSGSNTNTVTASATVNTEIDTTLSYIPGTAVRRHNIGTNASPNWVTEKIPDTVTTSGFTIPTMKPCNNFQESIYVQARVNASVLSVQKFVKLEGSDKWLTTMDAKPGDKLAFLVVAKNEGNTKLTNLLIRDSFPPKLKFVNGSAILINTTHPAPGIPVSDNVINGGIFVGDYQPGANAQIRFNAMVPNDLPNGCTTFKNVVNAKANETGFIHNEADVRVCVNKPTPPTPPTPTPTVTTASVAPTQLPVTGPIEGFGALFSGTALAGSIGGWVKSKRKLSKTIKK